MLSTRRKYEKTQYLSIKVLCHKILSGVKFSSLMLSIGNLWEIFNVTDGIKFSFCFIIWNIFHKLSLLGN